MLVDIYIFYEVIMIGFFITAFFIKNEILWAISAVFSGILMFSSFDIQVVMYEFNSTISAYSPSIITNHYMYLVWINGIFFTLCILLGLFDLFDKYGGKLLNKEKDEEE
jgi:hypothetical protein